MRNLLNYLLALPFAGLTGTLYFGHLEETSAAVARLGYDAWRRTLDIHFVRGRSTYRYPNIGIGLVLRLLAARSLGTALNKLVLKANLPGFALTWRPRAERQRLARKQATKHVNKSPRQIRKLRKTLNKMFRWSRQDGRNE
jgi:hypothetical protein